MSSAQDLLIFGGSFDPPHVGHLTALQDLKTQAKDARVIVLPTYGNSLKTTETAFEHRLKMAALAFEKVAPVLPTEQEQKLNFTWQVLQYFSHQYKRLTFVIGTDQLGQLERWSRFPEVLKMANWTVLIRRPQTIENALTDLKKLLNLHVLQSTSDPREYEIVGSSCKLSLFETEAPDISSTRIREQIALKKQNEVLKFIPTGVYDYIERNHLYGI